MLPTTHNFYYMLNPISKRSIVIGGRVYKDLVKKGIIDPKTNQPINVLKDKVSIEEKPVLTEKEEDEEKLIVVEDIKNKRRDNNLISTNNLESMMEDLEEQKIDSDELSKVVAKASENVMNKYKEKLALIEDEDDLYDEVKRLIDDELKIILTI